MEQSLVDQVGRGEWLDLAADDEVIDEASMRSWGDSRTCRATVIRDILRGRLAPDPDPHGLRVRGARISGRLDLANLTTEVHFELRDCLLEEGILARDARLGTVALTGCRLEHSAESPLDADRLTCSVLDLKEATIIGHRGAGAVSLLGAHVDQLNCTQATLRSDSGPALDAEGLQVGQSVFLRHRFTAASSSEFGAVRLAGARIGGQLDCTGAHMGNDSGSALLADRLQLGQSMYLVGRFTAAGKDGAVRLPSAHIRGQLSCIGAYLDNRTGPALAADGLQVEQALLLRGGFTATGAGEFGAVRLVGARIGGQLECNDAALGNDSGPALSAPGLQVSLDTFLTGLTATGAGDHVTIDLTGARLGGRLRFDPARLEHAGDPHGRLAVDGLTHAGVPQGISARGWLELLRDGTRGYMAQPYQHLALGYRALGNERQAREILMAQRDDEFARTNPRWSERLWGRITKLTLGYGYQPWRALLLLAAVAVLSCVLAWALGSHGALAQTGKAATPGKPCTVIQQVSVGLDLNLPVGTSLARADCDLTRDSASVTARWLSATGWALRVLAWAFAALFIAGFTSAVRKT